MIFFTVSLYHDFTVQRGLSQHLAALIGQMTLELAQLQAAAVNVRCSTIATMYAAAMRIAPVAESDTIAATPAHRRATLLVA